MKRVLLMAVGLLFAIGAGWALANLALGGLGQAATVAVALAGGALALMGISTGGGQGAPTEPDELDGPYSPTPAYVAQGGSDDTSSSNADSGSTGGSDGGSSGSSGGE